MKTLLKKLIPPSARLQLRIAQRTLRDLRAGHQQLFVKKHNAKSSLPSQISINQPIRNNRYSDNKIHNLKLAASFIENLEIIPGQIFSYWHLIPRPTLACGFKEGRNLLGDQLATDIGGGLCQLSGIIYHLCLIGGLEIIERHPHSLDIYTEENRYTPLGSDATVVYGYKDLRIKNNLQQTLSFQFDIQNDQITANLCAIEKIIPLKLRFEHEHSNDKKLARVFRNQNNEWQLVSQDFYTPLKK